MPAAPRLGLRDIGRFGGIIIQIKKRSAARFDLVDELPRAVAQAEKAEGIVGEEEGHSCFLKGGGALPLGRGIDADEIADRAGDVDEAHGAGDADLVIEAGEDEEEGDVEIFFVDEVGVAEVAVVLAEGFAVVAENK